MIIDIRYHIASLAAVFIALGIGILVGSFLNGDDFLVRQQHHLIAMLENDVHKIMLQKEDLVAQINNLENSRKLMQEFVNIVSPKIISGVLKDKVVSVLFVTCSIDQSLMKGIEEVIKTAGGNLGAVFSLGSALGSSLDIQTFYTLLGLPIKPGNAEFGRVIGEIALGIVGNGNSGFIAHLVENEVLTVNGNLDLKPDVVVFIANSADRQYSNTKIDSALVEGIREHGVRLVAAEVSTVEQTHLTYYIQQSIATVDNIETYLGKTALILVAAGVDGNFGVRKTASSFFPSPLINFEQEDKRWVTNL